MQALIHVFGQTGFLVAYTIKSATHPSVIDRFTSVSFFPLLPYTPTTDLTPWLGKFSSTLITCQLSCFWQTIAHLPICWGNSVFLVVFWPCAFLSRTYWVGIWRSRMSKSSWNLCISVHVWNKSAVGNGLDWFWVSNSLNFLFASVKCRVTDPVILISMTIYGYIQRHTIPLSLR